MWALDSSPSKVRVSFLYIIYFRYETVVSTSKCRSPTTRPRFWFHAEPPVASGRKLDLSYPTTDFVQQVKNWEAFDSASMSIVVAHMKSFVTYSYGSCRLVFLLLMHPAEPLFPKMYLGLGSVQPPKC